MNTKELIKSLPGSWEELKLKDYIRLTDIQVKEDNTDDFTGLFNGMDNTIQVASILSGMEPSDLESLPMGDIGAIGAKLSFLSKEFIPSNKSSIKWKDIEGCTYNDYITFLNLSKDPIKNLTHIVQAFGMKDGKKKKKFTNEEVLEMSVQDAMTGFFLLRILVKKYLKRSIRSSRMKVIRQVIKETWKNLLTHFKRKRDRKGNG